MRSLLVALAVLALVPTVADAQKNCTKGKPCGRTCIARDKVCRIGTTQAAPPAAAQAIPSGSSEYRLLNAVGASREVLILPGVPIERAAFLRVARAVCLDAQECRVYFWTDASKAPAAGAVSSPAQFNARVAVYRINQTLGSAGFQCHPFGTEAERCGR